MNIETRYFNLKHDIEDDVRGFLRNPSIILNRHRKGERLNDTFAGVLEEPKRGAKYILTLFLSDYRTKEKIRTRMYVDREFNIINEETISA